jgi:hypothetical protein
MEKWGIPALTCLLGSVGTFAVFISALRERVRACEKDDKAMKEKCAEIQERKETERVELKGTLGSLTAKVEGLKTDLTKQIADLTLEVRVMNGRDGH